MLTLTDAIIDIYITMLTSPSSFATAMVTSSHVHARTRIYARLWSALVHVWKKYKQFRFQSGTFRHIYKLISFDWLMIARSKVSLYERLLRVLLSIYNIRVLSMKFQFFRGHQQSPLSSPHRICNSYCRIRTWWLLRRYEVVFYVSGTGGSFPGR